MPAHKVVPEAVLEIIAVGIGFTVITVATVVLGEAISVLPEKNLAAYAPEVVAA